MIHPDSLTRPPADLGVSDEPPDESSRFVFVHAYAALVARWRASADKRHADLEALEWPADAVHLGAAVLKPVLDPRKVDRFCRLMALEGWAAQSERMRFDLPYARELLSLGHTSPSADLRRLALELFRLYEAQRVWH